MNIARKRFGQNFLIDPGIVGRITRAIDANAGEHIIEIGPGQGALTAALIDSGCQLKLIEIDRDLADELKARHPGIDLIPEDVMKLDFQNFWPDERIRIIGNLPYNISTPLLFKLFEYGPRISDMLFMLQLEVVDRMTAASSTRPYGRLSVMTQLYCEAEKLFEVPPEAFSPRPKVRSAIVSLRPRETRLTVDPAVLEEVLIRAFSARRKTVRNGLKSLLSADELESLDIDPALRPENLTAVQFAACANHIADKRA